MSSSGPSSISLLTSGPPRMMWRNAAELCASVAALSFPGAARGHSRPLNLPSNPKLSQSDSAKQDSGELAGTSQDKNKAFAGTERGSTAFLAPLAGCWSFDPPVLTGASPQAPHKAKLGQRQVTPRLSRFPLARHSSSQLIGLGSVLGLAHTMFYKGNDLPKSPDFCLPLRIRRSYALARVHHGHS
jgi:hypothetical protein